MKDFDREYMLDQFEKLLAIDSTSGQFREMQDYIQAEMERLGFEPKTLRKGRICVPVRPSMRTSAFIPAAAFIRERFSGSTPVFM